MKAWMVAAVALAGASGPATAAEQEKYLDLSNPEVVASAIRTAGYKAELKTNSKGEPLIASSTNGSDFTVEFYGCNEARKGCGSFQFYAWYKKDPFYTLEMINEWNAKKRFLKVAIDGDGDLAQSMDFTSVGRVNQTAFADMLDWYTVMDGELGKFLSEKRTAAGKPAS
ncbi:YbjN domain-containing protein [Sphingomonas sp.]|uniref:YbjN domain-containing protein n=1 Tax=Sphingomonas sp. TaxID=28214 RepID=UPI002C1FB0B3|nr:YbjN domain-containing protein [Sphingomonas sp.]HWK36779.1 YbjN domain-containing protein [Sphingomonas sp.]